MPQPLGPLAQPIHAALRRLTGRPIHLRGIHGFHCRPTGMRVSDVLLSRRDAKIARLYEQGADHKRIARYLARWLGWAGLAGCGVAAAGLCPNTTILNKTTPPDYSIVSDCEINSGFGTGHLALTWSSNTAEIANEGNFATEWTPTPGTSTYPPLLEVTFGIYTHPTLDACTLVPGIGSFNNTETLPAIVGSSYCAASRDATGRTQLVHGIWDGSTFIDIYMTDSLTQDYTISIAKDSDGAENNEGVATPAVFTVTVTPANGSGSTITGDIVYTGSATNGTDYATGITSFSIPNGSSTATITLDVTEDTLVEGNETITATISNTTPGTVIGIDQATGNLADDDVASYTVTGTADPAVGGSVVCDTPVNEGASSTCTANTAAGYSLTGFSANCPGSGTTCTVSNVTGPTTVIATFTLDTFAVTAATEPRDAGAGTVQCLPSPANYGDTVTCTATAGADYAFDGFTGDCTGDTCAIDNVSAPIFVTATFSARAPTPVAGAATAQPIPALGLWGLAGLSGLVGLFGFGAWRRRAG